jgi:hypothetical protein
VLIREAASLLANARLGSLTLQETRVYAGYEAGREAALKSWLHNFLDRQPGFRVFTWSRASNACTIVRHWSAPVPWTGNTAVIRRRVERMTNRRLDADDLARPLTAAEWHERDEPRRGP